MRDVSMLHQWALEHLERAGLPATRHAVARAMGEDPAHWWHYLKGKRTPTLPKMIRWCRSWAEAHPTMPVELSISLRGLDVDVDWDTLDER